MNQIFLCLNEPVIGVVRRHPCLWEPQDGVPDWQKFPSEPPDGVAKALNQKKITIQNTNNMANAMQDTFPYFKSCVQGSFNQNDTRFGDSAGIQCACNTLTSVCWSVIRRVNIWKTIDLDFVLTKGNELFEFVNLKRSLFFEELPKKFRLAGTEVEIEFTKVDNGFFVQETNSLDNFLDINLFFSDNVNGVLLFFQGYTVSLLKDNKENVYVFDSHSRDIHGQPSPEDKSILMNFQSSHQVLRYLTETYKNILTLQIVYVKVHSLHDEKQKSLLKVFSQFKKQIMYLMQSEQRKEQFKANYKKNSVKRKDQFKKNYENNLEQRKTQFKSHYVKNITKRKEQIKTCQKVKTEKCDRVKQFKTNIKQGPYFVCVSCNRSMYQRSVKLIGIEKYNILLDDTTLSFVSSYDGNHYICNTCDRKLKKKELPAQCVLNKLELYNFPDHLRNMNKLERILISQRILFSKISIMPKGQFPKIKGTICNIPLQVDSMCETLPRSIDDSNILFIKLKKKLSFKSHVFSEAVRPDYVVQLLNYLKSVNLLYKDVYIRQFFENINNNEEMEIDFIDDDQVDFIITNSHPQSNLIKFVTDDDVQLIIDYSTDTDEFENEDRLNEYRSACNETVLVSKCPHVIADDENMVIAPGEGKAPLFILKDENCEELAHPHLFPHGKFGLHAKRDVKLTHTKYFNQRLLNYTQRFASDPDYIFFANFLSQQINLRNQINIAMKKVCGQSLTANMFQDNFKDTVKSFLADENAYSFMNAIKGSPAYWKNTLSDVLAMVKQLGIPSFFLTLSCADLRWNEFPEIISKLNGKELSFEEISALSYFQKCELLNSNPVLLARHFQYRVEMFFKNIVMNGTLGKIVYYIIRVEFQTRGSPHVHCLLWAKDMPVLSNETFPRYERFVDSIISANIPQENTELRELIKKFQVHHHSKTCKKYSGKECRFGYGKFFSNRTIIAKPLPEHLLPFEKVEILEKQKSVLDKVKHFIDSDLNPKKRNFLNPDKDNYNPITMSVENILELLDITLADYEEALSISTDPNDYQIHLKRNPISCFVNNYFEEGLLAWEANIDLQPVFNHYKAIHYMCAYFSKNESLCSDAMKEALNQSKELESSKYERMIKLAKAYSDHREVSIQEAVYQLMPELWLRKGYPAVSFVSTSLPNERFRMMKTEEEIIEMPEDSDEIFKRNMLDRYVDRPNRTFLRGKFSVCNDLCYAQFTANYRLDSKINYEEVINDCQPIVLSDLIVEENHESSVLPKVIPLMTHEESLKCRKVPKVLRYFTPNKHKYPEKYAHHLLMLFFPFRNEERDLRADGSYANKLLDPLVLEIVNRNKIIFEPNADIVEDALRTYREDLALNFNAYAQQENEHVITEIPNDDVDIEENEINNEILNDLPPASSMPTTISDDELNRRIGSLNQRQREIFDVVYTWGKNYIQSSKRDRGFEIEPLYIFLTGNGGCGKSFLIKCMFEALNKLFSYKGDNSKANVMLLAPTGVAAININGTTLHTGLGIPCTNFHQLSDKQRTNLRMKLENISAIFIDEISMVSAKLLLQTHQRLCEIFGTSDSIPFAGKTVIVSGDLYQLPPVLAKPVFSMDGFIENTLKLWLNFKLAELNETMRQQGDNEFIDLLNNVRTASLSSEDEKLLKSRFISNNSNDYPKNALHIFAENSLVNEHNLIMLASLSNQLLSIFAMDDYPTGSTQKTIDSVREKKSSDTGGLLYKLDLKIECRVMLTSNVDIEDRLINGQIGTIKKFNVINGKVGSIFVKFDDETAGLKQRGNNRLNSNYVSIEQTVSKFNITKRKSSGVVTRTQFPLVLAYACTVHKVQGLTLDKIVVSFQLERQRNFNSGQIYVALSRATSLNGLFLTGNYSSSAITASGTVHKEYQRLRSSENLLKPLESFSVFDSTLNMTLLNIRSLLKHAGELKHHKEIISNDVLLLTETQIEQYNINVENINQNLDDLSNFIFNNNVDKFKSLFLGYTNDINILNSFKMSGFLLFEMNKSSFSDLSMKVLLVYRSHQQDIQSFMETLSNLLRNHNDISIIFGDFNIDLLKINRNSINLKNLLFGFKQIVDKPTHIDGGLIDHIYIRECFLDIFEIDLIKCSLNFSDHDALKIRLKLRVNHYDN